MTPEARLTSVFGLSRNKLRALRVKILVEGVDWKFEHRAASYADSGIQKIAAHLSLGRVASAPAASSALPDPITLLVWNPRLTNTRMILAYAPDTDPQESKNILRVRVRSSENFVRFVHGKPMAIKARHIQADLYELAGQCPRRKGWVQPE